MPRSKKPQADHVHQHHLATASDGARELGARAGAVSRPKRQSTAGTSALTSLRFLFYDDTGWLRAVPQDAGDKVFFKWKWSKGRFAGSYVMWVCDDGDIDAALEGLAEKVRLVYEGRYKPTPDQPYD